MRNAYTILLEINDEIRQQYSSRRQRWLGSPFEWIISLPSRTVGAVAEQIVHVFLERNGFIVKMPSKSSDYDRLVQSHFSMRAIRLEIKFSMLWEDGMYVFQQIRNQDYDYIFCLGISPQEAHAWLLPKQVALQNAPPQHGGKKGTDTRWLHINPREVPNWLIPYGGSLDEVLSEFRRILEEE